MLLTISIRTAYTCSIYVRTLYSFRKTNNALTGDFHTTPEVFLEFSQNSHENTCVRVSFLIKLQAYSYPAQILMSKANDRSLPAWRPATLLKRMQHRCFPVKYAKFWRTSANDRFCTAKGCARRKSISESIKILEKEHYIQT